MGTLSQNGYGDMNLFVRLFLYMNFLDPLFPLGFSSCRTPHRQPDALNAHKPGTTISAQPASQTTSTNTCQLRAGSPQARAIGYRGRRIALRIDV